MDDRKDYYTELEGSTYKISLFLDKKDLFFVIETQNQFIPIKYEMNMKKSDFIGHSKYFNRFSNINEISYSISKLIDSNKYSLKKDPINKGYIIFALYPDSMEESDENEIEIEFKIPLIKLNSDSIVKNLFEIIAEMSMKINELNDKVQK